ncbi:MAG: hypothetical protein ACLTNY_07315, partial [Blautia massiliensis (ex Durand et al. 2017)]
MQKTNRFSRLLAVLVAVFMAVCCLPLSAFAEGSAKTTVRVEFSFVDQETNEVVKTLPGQVLETGTYSYADFADYLPEGYEAADPTGTFTVKEACTVTFPVRKPAEDGMVRVEFSFVDQETNEVVKTLPGQILKTGTYSYADFADYLPEGYEAADPAGTFTVKEAGTVTFPVRKIVTEVNMNIRFMDGDTFIAGGDYMLPAGVQNYSILEQYVPAGYKMTVTGDFQVTAGGKLDVNVEKITDTVVMNIRFMEGENFIAGGDYMLPAGVQNYSI